MIVSEQKMTPAQKAAITRRLHMEARREKEQHRANIIAALEAIIQDKQSSRESIENALFLLAHVYRGY